MYTRIDIHQKEELMRKLSVHLALAALLIFFCSFYALSQEDNLIGTWAGSTFIPDQGEDEVTLVITKEEGELAATMSDSLGMLVDTECEDIEFDDGTLTYNFTISQDMESMTIWITLNVEGDTMNGYWETAEGDQGDIQLKKN
jgi:hypothetical protein